MPSLAPARRPLAGYPRQMGEANPRGFGIYVHVPWCRTRCPYCAFNVYPERDALWERWADGVVREWGARAPAFVHSPEDRAHSVYFGGGTPSLARPEQLGTILAALPRAADAELTLEANPGGVDRERLAAWRQLGINRLSLGIQTFDERFARLLNRGHTVLEARALCELVADSGLPTWSVDVIFGLPGQSVDDLRQDLSAILALAPPHVSLYGLSYEPGTPFGRAHDQGRMRPLDPELWRAQYDLLVETLGAGGWERYEVSNFARPGHRARHNEATWRGGHYAGLGPGAHGFEPDGHRTVNRAEPADWLSDWTATRELPSPLEAAIDLVLSTLRHREGLPLPWLEARTAHRVDLRALRALLEPPRGAPRLLLLERDTLRLSEQGFPLADGIVARVVDALVHLAGS